MQHTRIPHVPHVIGIHTTSLYHTPIYSAHPILVPVNPSRPNANPLSNVLRDLSKKGKDHVSISQGKSVPFWQPKMRFRKGAGKQSGSWCPLVVSVCSHARQETVPPMTDGPQPGRDKDARDATFAPRHPQALRTLSHLHGAVLSADFTVEACRR